MKYFDINNLKELKKEGYVNIVCIPHISKDEKLIAYLYPFRDKGFADFFVSESIEHEPEIFQLDDDAIALLKKKKIQEYYLTGFKDLYKRSSFFDNSETIFMLLDKDLTILDLNDTLVSNHKILKLQFLGKNFSEISSSATEAGLRNSLLEVIDTGKPLVLNNVKGDERYGGKYYRVKAFKVGNGVGVSSSNIDVFKNVIHSLEEYAYRSSHDIRSPISNIQGLLDFIEEDNEQDPEKLRSYLKIIKNQIGSLDGLTEMLLESIKMEKQERPVERIDFDLLLQEIWQSLNFMDGINEVTLNKDIQPTTDFHFDRTVLFFLFQNLIENAVKYRRSKDENKAFVNVKVRQIGTLVEINVADNGIGIADDKRDNVFSIFFRAHGSIPGNGLGLYTLKKTIERFGGTISIDTKEDEGTCFTIALPSSFVKMSSE